MEATAIPMTQGLPLKWSWLLFDDVLSNDLFDGLESFDAVFVAASSPASRFSRQFCVVSSGDTDPEITKFEPNRIDLVLGVENSWLCETGFYSVDIIHKTNSNLSLPVARGRLLVARSGRLAPVVTP